PPRLRQQGPASSRQMVRVPAGIVTLGTPDDRFAWDNERPQHQVEVGAFEVDADDVTNADYLAFVEQTGAPPPPFWVQENGEWRWRGMFESVPLPLDWPVYVTWDEASAYARWAGARLMTEAEYHRAAEGASPGN